MNERVRSRICSVPADWSPATGTSLHAQVVPEHGRVVMSWSGGKDSAMALQRLRADPRYEVSGLLTTFSRRYRRVSHHGVREELMERQAEAIGLPLHKLYFGSESGDPKNDTMEEFHRCLDETLATLRADGTFLVAHGDINLESLRAYRESRLRAVGMRALFPLWGEPTSALLRSFTAAGFRAVITCVEPVAKALAGLDLSSALLDSAWPAGVDPCGENGEYHSFVYDGPIFTRPVAFDRGVTITRDGRHYTDLIPSEHTTPHVRNQIR
jgi:uncharacterized protein (TIGR00290 family)